VEEVNAMLDMLARIDWAELIIPTHSLAEMAIRGTFMYLGLFLIFRFIVQRQSSAIGMADLLVIIIIADAAQNAFSKEYKSITEGVTLVLTIVFWDFVLDWLAYRSEFFKWLVRPAPLPLIENGKMQFKNMKDQLISADELRSQARQQGIEDIAEVKSARLEGNGEISFIKDADRAETTGTHRREDAL
jgi:uncharacterized membrane protein YcaP (DUF421 family)